MNKIAVLNSIVEAQVLEAMLKERAIPYVLKSYHDSAYDGLFQGTMGWGHIEAEDEHTSEVLELIDELRKQS